MNNRIMIIAEIGPNHNGDFNTAVKLIEIISKLDVDVIKFQIANPRNVYSKDSFKADYQKQRDGDDSIISMSKRNQLSKDDHIKLSKICKINKIKYACSAFDIESLDFLYKNIKIPFFKIPSGEINSIDILKYISMTNIPSILSTGMANEIEIKSAIKTLQGGVKLSKKNVSLLHCVSKYPTKIEDLNLRYITTLKEKFNCRVGFSDHTIGNESSLVAVAHGAEVIEKHVTLDRFQKGPDHYASSDIFGFSSLVKSIRRTEIILGKFNKQISKEEKNISLFARKSIVAIRDLKKGDSVYKKDVCYKRPGTGISPMQLNQIIGKRLKKNVKKDSVIKFSSFK